MVEMVTGDQRHMMWSDQKIARRGSGLTVSCGMLCDMVALLSPNAVKCLSGRGKTNEIRAQSALSRVLDGKGDDCFFLLSVVEEAGG